MSESLFHKSGLFFKQILDKLFKSCSLRLFANVNNIMRGEIKVVELLI